MSGKIYSLILTLLISLAASAAPHSGTISKLRGKVELLHKGTKKVEGSGPHVLYNGFYYKLLTPKIGDAIKAGQIVRTGKRSLVRIIFDNGDQFVVGPGSEYSLKVSERVKDEASLINLTRGKLRAIISKNGPRNNMKVETRNVAMGVRGTDFFVDAKGHDRSEVSVIRGEVKLKQNPKKTNRTKSKVSAEEVSIKTGYSAHFSVEKKLVDIVKNEKKKMKGEAQNSVGIPTIKVKRTTKEKLVNIQKNTVVTNDDDPKEKIDKKVEKKIESLEKKAVKVTLDDIKTHTPELYKKISEEKVDLKNAETLSTKVVAEAFKKAPKEEKAGEDDLEDLDEGAYNKYFKF